MSAHSGAPLRLIILGSTGSIGGSTLEVVRHLRGMGRAVEVVGLATGRSGEALAAQAREMGVRHLALAEGDAPDLPAGCTLHRGADGALALVDAVARPGDVVMAAMVGYAGLAPTLAAIERGCPIALANKETLVAAGALVTAAAARRGVPLLPVDSEHNAIFQCLRSGAPREVRRIVLTASGGPFRTWERDALRSAPPSAALQHPTWRMGPKITIDSASMMNKALEVIEAHWLFDLPAERIDAIVHPASVVHGLVEFQDGSVIAQLSPPDMKLPILSALAWPERLPGCSPQLDWTRLRSLAFEPVDHERFPAIGLGWQVVRRGGTSGAVLNAANEEAVRAYLAGEVSFGCMTDLVAGALESVEAPPLSSLRDVVDADARAREFVRREAARSRPSPAPARHS
ncbi:MAG: 1-deoxy-D-xylulose-5-phosphate reductoisomerase [Phycisphaerales bacterium]